jgi:hypothetical protein
MAWHYLRQQMAYLQRSNRWGVAALQNIEKHFEYIYPTGRGLYRDLVRKNCPLLGRFGRQSVVSPRQI